MTTTRINVACVLAAVILSAACAGAGRSSAASRPDTLRLRSDVEFLASDALGGRGTGTPGNESAASFAARRYAALGLQSLTPGYLQPFLARPSGHAASSDGGGLRTQNIVAFLPGSDPTLRGQVIVMGAHIDHLGRSSIGALDPDAVDAIRNGADDNASGSAAVLELARLFSARPTRRSLLFANFSGEELGLLGAQHFVQNSPVRVDSIVAMLNFDMVGRSEEHTSELQSRLHLVCRLLLEK